MRAAIATLASLLLLAGCGSNDAGIATQGSAPEQTKLTKAFNGCRSENRGRHHKATLADEGHSILIDTGKGDDIDATACILLGLNTPERIISEMDSTTAMMGRQSATAAGITYEWSYHPDTGINMVITDQ